MDNNNLFSELSELMHQQIKEAYIEGIHKGVETACAIIYQTMKTAGLEESNLLFYILKDLAKQYGCEDLPTLANKLQNKTAPSSGDIPS